MNELLLKAGLTEEQVSTVIATMNEAKLYTTKEQNIEQRYAKLKTQKTDLEAQLTAANTTIDELKQSNLTNTELQAQIEAHKTKVLEIEAAAKEKVRTLTLDNAISSKLGEFDAKYHALLTKAFDRDTLNVGEDGVITGLDEQYTNIKETYKDLLKPNLAGNTPPNPSGTPKGVTKEQFTNMTYTEKLDLYNTQPDLYKEYTQN
ncbi:MAG: phage scaffolding protein [Sarcina sp.]